MKITKKIIFLGLAILFIFLAIGLFFYQKNQNLNEIQKNTIFQNQDQFENKTDFKFAIFGDVHYKGGEEKDEKSNFTKARNFIQSQNTDLVFTIGDNLSSCDEKDCQKKIKKWKSALGQLNSKLFFTTGNHDLESEDKKMASFWTENSNLPENGPDDYKKLVYSFNYGNSHFVVLASNLEEHKIDDKQLAWLENDLKNNQKPNTFIFFHEPAFPIKDKVDESLDNEEEQRDKFWQIVDKYNITAVFSGHEHLHSRRLIDERVFSEAKNKIYQFIVGNTNYLDHPHTAPEKLSDVKGLEYTNEENVVLIVEVENEKIVVNLYSVEGKLLNSFDLR